MKVFYPLATTTWDEAEIHALHSVIESGFFSMGNNVQSFEKEFASFFGSRYCVMVNSGSSANLLMVAASLYTKKPYLKSGDEVIVPAVSWSTTYFPFHQYGIKLKFLDIDPKSLNLDISIIEELITPKTKAICAVNLLGNPCDLVKLSEICHKHNIILLEDNCESMGASINGKYAGTFGLAGTFSSFFSHHISTMEGGMVLTDDEELYQVMLSMRAHGWTRNLPKQNHITGIKSENSFEESFRFVLPGYNLRPLEFSGAIGIQQMKKLPEILSGRRKNAALFKSLFENHPVVDIQQENFSSSWFGFAMITKEQYCRDEILRELENSGIEFRPIVAGNFTKNPVISYIDHAIPKDLVFADMIDKCGFFVGNHHYDIAPQLLALKKCLDKFII